MRMNYPFRREFYYKVEQAIQQFHMIFLLGPRKCGKTIGLWQLEAALPNAQYTDVKSDFETDARRRNFVDGILESIKNNDNLVYLIDEATYLALPDKEIAKIAAAFSRYENDSTKIVFTGSQSTALSFWGHIACGGNAAYIQTSFLTYPEWLAYKESTEVSEESYLDFLLHKKEFYTEFGGVKEYLQGCLDETVISNRKAIEYVIGNDAESLSVDMLLDVLYASLVKLHNHTNVQRFTDKNLFQTMLEYHFETNLTENEKKQIYEILGSRYQNFTAMNGYDCKLAMRFLANCGLVTITYVSDEWEVDPYICEKILKDSNEWYRKPEVFQKFNITINDPMFYLDLVQAVLKEEKMETIPRDLLGSIVECHVRSLLPTTGSFSYHDTNGREIDYVSPTQGIEISVSNKRLKNTNLNLLPDHCKKILLTKDKEGKMADIQCIPYYRYIFEQSDGKSLMKERGKGQEEDFLEME